MSAVGESHEAKHPRPVDWAAVRGRLARVREAIDRGDRPSLEESRKLLKARARALASLPEASLESDREALTVVEFMLASEHYGIESRFVREVDPMKELTPIPCTPSFVLGVVNLRGEVISVVDLKRLFDLPMRGLTELDRILVVRADSMQFGIHADSVLGIRQIPLEDLETSVSSLANIREEFIMGMTRDNLTILDGRKLLATTDLIVNEEVEA